MKLKDKADLPVAKLAQCGLIVERQLLAAKKYFAPRRPVEGAEDMQQGALTDARLANYRQTLPSAKSKLTSRKTWISLPPSENDFCSSLTDRRLFIADNFYRIQFRGLARRVEAGQ